MADRDPHLGARWARIAVVARGERAAASAALKGILGVLAAGGIALRESGYDPAVLGPDTSWDRGAPLAELLSTIEGQFITSWGRVARGDISPDPYALRHIEAATNRLKGVPDAVFDNMRTVIAEGRQAQEGIPQIAARIDALLGDTDRWKARATTIARTEVLTANRAGSHGAAGAAAQALGYTDAEVAKAWLATQDSRTRESHADADGQIVLGLDTAFDVADAPGQVFPDEPNCRCDVLYYFPGDPEYPTISAGAAMTAAATEPDDDPTGVVVVALPAETDPVHGIGEEEKHATILFYGDVADLPAGYLDSLRSIVAGYAQTVEPFTETVEGVDSLGADGARVWLCDPQGQLTAVHDDLPDYDSEAAPPDSVQQFPTYTPHVTIGYPDGSEEGSNDAAPADDVTTDLGGLAPEVETAAGNVSRITFDRLAVWAGPDQTEYPLTGTAPDDTKENPVPAPLAASAQRRQTTAAALREAIDALVQSGAYGSREAAVRALTSALHTPLRAAAGDPAPVVVDDPPAEELAVGEPAPPMMGEDGWGPNPDRFHGICTVEDEQTGDGRVFAAGSIYWDEAGLPMPLGWQVADAPGHDGSVICGRIDSFERVGNAITYTGTWDLDGAGWETRRLVQGQFLRGISVDTDDNEVAIVNQDGTPVDGFDMMMGEAQEPVMLVQRSRLRSSALCRVPAFAPSGTDGAYIANGLPDELQAAVDAGLPPADAPAEEVATAALVASAVAAALPAAPASVPPASWFSDPGLQAPTPVTITDDGRVFGHLAAWGTCHIGVQGTCVTPPHSQMDYANFAHGVTMTSDGPIITGTLTMDTGHAGESLRALPAAAHYDNTGTQWATVAVGEDAIGIWVAGARTPEATDDQINRMRRAGALSGDWRLIRGNLELVAALGVNTPGFPLPRLSIAASAAEGQTALVAAGIVTRDVALAEQGAAGLLSYEEVRSMVASALADERATAERVSRIARASATLRRSRATAAAARIGG